ncbi:MAG: zinc ribbon domain-containing protein [Gemmatimonadota bacterium]
MNETVVAQLHRSLVDAMRRSRPGSLHHPVTVAEIYRDLLPYREARTAIGFDMNADYEHALLRLLAGEGDLARIEPREVRDKLRMELESPNPDVGLFRNYAACDVWVSIDDLADAAETAEAASSWEDEFLNDDAGAEADIEFEEDDEPQTQPVPEPHAPPRFEIAADQTAAQGTVDAEQVACAFCGAELPDGRPVNFCPFCGSDQSQQPCPSCGEMLEPLWRYCVACGARSRPLGDHVN